MSRREGSLAPRLPWALFKYYYLSTLSSDSATRVPFSSIVQISWAESSSNVVADAVALNPVLDSSTLQA